MKKIFLVAIAIVSINGAFAQNTFKAQIKDAITLEPLIGSTALLKELMTFAFSIKRCIEFFIL